MVCKHRSSAVMAMPAAALRPPPPRLLLLTDGIGCEYPVAVVVCGSGPALASAADRPRPPVRGFVDRRVPSSSSCGPVGFLRSLDPAVAVHCIVRPGSAPSVLAVMSLAE